jgi:uncharacterized iron-regulated membrane protein
MIRERFATSLETSGVLPVLETMGRPSTKAAPVTGDSGTATKPRFRKLWLKVHRWLGLTAGLLFVLLGLTGSLLVFDHAIDEWLNPELLLTEGAGQRCSLREVVARAEDAYPGNPSRAAAISSPRVRNGVWTAWFQSGTEEAPKWTAVYVDPYSGEITGQRVWGEDLVSLIYKLHYTLLGGNLGKKIVGIAGLVLMVSICSGVYLWWPLWKSGWRAGFAIRRGKRLNYDLHKTVGIFSTVVLLVIAFTGVYMIFPEWIKPVVTVFSPETNPPEELKSTASQTAQSITPDQAVAIANSRFPAASFCHFHPPEGTDGVYEVALRQPGEVQRSFGRTQVWIDQRTGTILAVRNPDDSTAADTFFAWQFPLHNGEAFGLVGRWVVFLSGLTPAVLYATGLFLWWRRGGSRRRQQQHRREA